MTAGLTNEEIEDRFFLLGRMEILNVLNELIARREPVSVYFNGGQESMLTTLLEARPEALIFDVSGDQRVNNRLMQSPTSVFVTSPDGVRVQFSGSAIHQFAWGGSDALWTPLPERLVRLQRRESYRILLPVANALKVKLLAEGWHSVCEWPLHDLSIAGLGAQMTGQPNLEPTQRITRMTFVLPNARAVECSGVARHVTPLGDRKKTDRYRIGIAFTDLTRATEAIIQRSLIAIEHERLKLLHNY